MSDPIDPNPQWEYQPPPPFVPPAPEQWQPYGGPVAYGWMPPPPPPPPPPSHRRRNVTIAASVAAVWVVAAAAYLLLRGSGSSAPDRLAVPPSFHGFVLSHDASAAQVESVIRDMGSAGGPIGQTFDAATIAVYEDRADVSSRLIVFALRSADLPAGAGPPRAFGQSMLTYMGQSVHDVPPGPHRGTELCGRTSVGGVAEAACSWADRATCGLVLSVSATNQPLATRRLSSVVQSLRDEID